MRLALRLSRLMLLAAMLLVSVPLVARSAQAPVNSLSRGAELQTRMALLRRMSDPKLTPVERRQLAQQAAATFSAGPVSISASQPNSTLDAPLGDCTQWSEWFPSTPVFSRVSHAMVYDVTGDRLVLFGGADDAGQASTEVWTLNLTGTPVWSLLATTGTPPSGRYNPSAVYDATRNRMIVFGGGANTNESDADHVYALSLGATPTWTDVSPPGTGPGARVYHTAIYDSGRDRVVVFGGYEFVSTGTVLNEVWAFSLAPGGVWTQITPAGTAPLARIEASAIYDAPRNRMVVFGGTLYDARQTNVGKTREVWSLTLTGTPTWSLLSPGGTSVTPLYGQTAIFDAPRNRMIVYGGVYDIDPSADRPENDVWSLSLTGGTSWSHLSPGGVLPSFGDNHEAVYDAAHQRMRVFGGYGGADETWSLSLNSGPTWAQENTGGIGPRSRVAHSMILDRAAQRVVVFGGQSNYGTLGDVWTHPISGPGAWTRLIPAGGHPTRRGHAAVYDSVGNRMVISGGFDDKSHALQDTWALSLTGTPTWSQLSPSGTPPPGRSDPASAYDRVRRRLLVWSGHDSASFVPLNDLWALSLSGSGSWTHIVAGGDAPNPIDIFTAAYDSQGDEFVVTGLVGSGSSPDVWRLPLVAGGTWTHFLPGADAPASANIQWSAFDPRRRRMIVGDLGGPVYALSLAGTPSWSRLGALGVAYPGHNHPTIVFDQLNDHLLAMGGYGGDYENSLWSQSVLETTHSLSVLAVPSYGGTVASSTQDECLVDGTQVTLTATPEPGYLFASWSGAASGTTNGRRDRCRPRPRATGCGARTPAASHAAASPNARSCASRRG